MTTESHDTTPNLQRDLARVLNRYSAESGSNTPDFTLAGFLLGCLEHFDKAVTERANWYGHMDKPAQNDDAREATWLRDIYERANPKPEMLSNTTGTKWAIVPAVLPPNSYLRPRADNGGVEIVINDPRSYLKATRDDAWGETRESVACSRFRVSLAVPFGQEIANPKIHDLAGRTLCRASVVLADRYVAVVQLTRKEVVFYTRASPTDDQIVELKKIVAEGLAGLSGEPVDPLAVRTDGWITVGTTTDPLEADRAELTWYRDLHGRAAPAPVVLSNTTGTRWAIVPREHVLDHAESARRTLAELGVLDPPTDLLRAQLMRDHAANARDLAGRAGLASGPFDDAENAAANIRNEFLRSTPMGATAEKSSPGLLASMARDAAAEVGASTDVHVESKQPDHSSRYVQYLLRVPEGASGSAYQDGIAVVTAVYANGKKHTFPRPIIIANGMGLADPRKPFHYRELVDALVAAGLCTNDVVGE